MTARVHHVNKGSANDPLDSVSGTTGLVGAADTIAVLKHDPNDKHGFLYVRGRDVHEAELALEFDQDTGRWTNLGTGRDFRRSAERKAVIDLLCSNREAMTPNQIAEALGKRAGTIRMLLSKMRIAGEISRLNNGKYYCVD